MARAPLEKTITLRITKELQNSIQKIADGERSNAAHVWRRIAYAAVETEKAAKKGK